MIELKEKIKIRIEIAKFKILFFIGVIGAGSYIVINYQKVLDFVCDPQSKNIHLIKIVIYIITGFLFSYGVAGIVKNLQILSKIEEEIK